jgi:hypothetical protein
MRASATLVALALVPSLIVGSSRLAGAQSAEAQELFDEGRRALASGDYATACTKLDASERLERAVGTLLSLAECEDGLGRLASERLHLQEAASWAEATHDPLNRGPVARKRFDEVDQRVPRVTLLRAPGAPADSRVARDGVDLGSAAFDAALPLDPGRHVFVVSAAGRSSATYELTLKERERRALPVEPGSEEQAPRDQRAGGASPTRHAASSQRAWAYGLGGVGVVGVVVGSVFGLRTLSTWSDAKRDCGAGCAQGSPARAEASSAQTDATVSTIALAAGGLALAAGAYLFFTATPDDKSAARVRVSPWMAAGGGGASLAGTWQ